MSNRGVSVSNSGWRCAEGLPRPRSEHAGLDAEGWGRKTRRILCDHRRACEPIVEKIDKIVMEELPWTALELTGRLEIVGSTGRRRGRSNGLPRAGCTRQDHPVQNSETMVSSRKYSLAFPAAYD